MPQRWTPLILAATLAVGVVVGLTLGRSGTTTPTARATQKAAEAPAAKGRVEGDEAIYRELARQFERFRPINTTFELVAKAVSPAVVHIVARKTGKRENGQSYLYEETGSGVIVRADRSRTLYVLTNHHVIDGAPARDVTITLHDGRVYRPERAHTDPHTDVAVLKMAVEDLPSARLGDSDEAVVGTWVLALGSPFGLTQSVTQGIISARMRHEDELESSGNINQEYLQTDAAINPGNSGGPLVNLKGEVIGLNTAIASEGGGSEGVGFSIPINLAKWAMGQLIAHGKVSRGAMGVRLENLAFKEALELGLPRPKGARIANVEGGFPADQAGVQVGDVVLRFNDIEVLNSNQLINLISMTPVGKTADLVVWRDRHEVPTKVAIIDRELLPPEPDPSRPGEPLRRPRLGLDLVTLDGPDACRRLGLPETLRGVAVAKIEPTSPLAGPLKPLDVLTTINGEPVRTAESAALVLMSRHPLSLGLQRAVDGTYHPLTVRVP